MLCSIHAVLAQLDRYLRVTDGSFIVRLKILTHVKGVLSLIVKSRIMRCIRLYERSMTAEEILCF